MPAVFMGYVDDAGHFALDRKAEFLAYVHQFKGQELALSVHPKSISRSLRANAYYWGVVLAMAEQESGQSANDIHCYWCELFLPDEKKRLAFFNRLTGERLQVIVDGRRTSKLTGTAFYDFVENCRLWCQEYLNVTTPDPDPEYWRKRSKTTEAA